MERITLTLPGELLKEIDRLDKNRSKFVAEAVRGELERRRRAGLLRSLQNPHPESARFADEGLQEWRRELPDEDAEALVESGAGKAIRWIAGEGWVEEGE